MKLSLQFQNVLSRGLASCGAFAILALGTSASAADVTVPNFSFETPTTGSFQDNNGLTAGSLMPSTNWYYLGSFAAAGSPAGVENTAANGGQTGGLGTQNLYLNRGAFVGSESLITIEANTTYTFTIAQARRGGGFAQTSGFTLALAVGSVAGDVNLANSTNWASFSHFDLPVTVGVFSDYTISFTTDSFSPYIGQNLFIVLGSDNPGSGNNPVDFDNARLDATSAVPEPSTWALVACAASIAMLRFRRRLAN